MLFDEIVALTLSSSREEEITNVDGKVRVIEVDGKVVVLMLRVMDELINGGCADDVDVEGMVAVLPPRGGTIDDLIVVGTVKPTSTSNAIFVVASLPPRKKTERDGLFTIEGRLHVRPSTTEIASSNRVISKVLVCDPFMVLVIVVVVVLVLSCPCRRKDATATLNPVGMLVVSNER